jgi:hypothetical protein
MPNRSDLPHYLRFARSLALVGALGLNACGDDTTRKGDTTNDTTVSDTSDASPDTALPDVTDVAEPDAIADTADAAVDCNACDCQATDASTSCQEVCCFAVGPLYPPDLPAA